jgi:isopenicillin N synthase-like dioxygenase
MDRRVLDIIDVSGLSSADPAAVKRVAAQLGKACRDTGFFYVTGHGIPDTLLSGVFKTAQSFFAAPLPEKDAISIKRSPHNRGYAGIASESLDQTHADNKEAFNVGLDLAPTDPEVIAGKPFRGVNLWPDTPSFRDTSLTYFDAVWKLGCDLHFAIASDLGLPTHYFDDKLDRPMATLRMLHYPPRDAAGSDVGAGTHTDYGSVTLLLTDDAGGLEVRKRDGTWIKAPPMANTFVCNIGDCLMRWSNDIYVSTPHRVVSPPGRDRYSVAFFLDPNPEALIECLPGCSGPDRPAKYPPILAADYLRQRLDATYKM